jgi:hypothetical protein
MGHSEKEKVQFTEQMTSLFKNNEKINGPKKSC